MSHKDHSDNNDNKRPWPNATGDDNNNNDNYDINREYKELLQGYKSELEHFEKARKKEIVLELAKKLLQAGLTFDMTKQQLIDDLRGYIHKTYIQRVIEEYYSQTRDSLQDDDKNVIVEEGQDEDQDATKSKEMTAMVTTVNDRSAAAAAVIVSSGEREDEEKAKNPKRDIKTLVESNDHLWKRTQELEAMNLKLSIQLQDMKAAIEEAHQEKKTKLFHKGVNDEKEEEEGFTTPYSDKILVKELIVKHTDDDSYQLLQIQKEEIEKELEELSSPWETTTYMEYKDKRIPIIVEVFPETRQVKVSIDESKTW
jgi:hypothetical protein